MKITKRQLKRIIREVIDGPDGVWYDDYGNRLQPDNPTSDVEKEEAEETNEAGDAYFVMVDDLVTSLGQNASKVNGTEDEVYIMTGQEEGITVKVVRRGR